MSEEQRFYFSDTPQESISTFISVHSGIEKTTVIEVLKIDSCNKNIYVYFEEKLYRLLPLKGGGRGRLLKNN